MYNQAFLESMLEKHRAGEEVGPLQALGSIGRRVSSQISSSGDKIEGKLQSVERNHGSGQNSEKTSL